MGRLEQTYRDMMEGKANRPADKMEGDKTSKVVDDGVTDKEDLGPALVKPDQEGSGETKAADSMSKDKQTGRKADKKKDVVPSKKLSSEKGGVKEEKEKKDDEMKDDDDDDVEDVKEMDDKEDDEKDEKKKSKDDMIKEIAAKMDGLKSAKVAKIYEALSDAFDEMETGLVDNEKVSFINRDEMNIDVTKDVEALVHGEDLTEDFKKKATLIFEAAVKDKVERDIESAFNFLVDFLK